MPPAAPVGAIFCEKGERARPAPPPACWLARLLSGDTDEDLRQQEQIFNAKKLFYTRTEFAKRGEEPELFLAKATRRRIVPFMSRVGVPL
jgi:hypothetical protein